MLQTDIRAEAARPDGPWIDPPAPKRPTTFFDDRWQTSNKDLGMSVRAPRGDDLSDPRELLLAFIDYQHEHLRAHIEEHRKALMERICVLTWPCQQPPGDATIRRAPPETYHASQLNTELDSPKDSHPAPIDESKCMSAGPTPKAIWCDIGCAIVDQTGSQTGPNEGMSATEDTRIKEKSKARVGDGLFNKPMPKFNSTFDLAVCMIICINVLVIIVQSHWQAQNASVALGFSDDSGWDGALSLFDKLEHVFAIVFMLELLARLWILRFKYFMEAANLFDVFLVLASILELYILTPLGKASGMSFTTLRFIRVCKIVRVLRVIRVMRLFLSLHIIVSTIIHSMASLFWSMLVLFLIILLGGLFMSQLLADYIMNDENPLDTRKWVYDYYGGSARATLTMFEVTMSGCWPNYSRRLVEEVSVAYVVFFVVYIAAVVFAVTRIISAIFLKDTLEAANSESDRMVSELKQKRDALMRQLMDFFKEADQSGDGFLDRDEFEEMLKNPKVRMWFHSLDLQVHEYVGVFNLIDNGSGVVDFQEFMRGVQRLKGSARSVDMLAVALDVSRIRHKLWQMQKELQQLSRTARNPSLSGLDREKRDMCKVMQELVETSGSARWLQD